jgi:hypothetical protein
MATPPDLRLFMNMAVGPGVTFANASEYDALIYPESNSQNILLGCTSNAAPAITIASNSITFGSTNTCFLSNATVGISTSNPTELIDVIGSSKISSNLYVMRNLSIGTSNVLAPLTIAGGGTIGLCPDSNFVNVSVMSTSNSCIGIGRAVTTPTQTLSVFGHTKVASNLYSMSNVGVGTESPLFPLSILCSGTGGVGIQLSNFGTQYIATSNRCVGFGTTTPTSTVTVGGGVGFSNFGQGAFLASSSTNIGFNTTTPNERIGVSNNMKISSNLYTMNGLMVGGLSNAVGGGVTIAGYLAMISSAGASTYLATSNSCLGIGMSNPTLPLSIAGGLAVGSQFIATSNSYIGFGTSNPTECLTVGSNSKVQSNAYIMQRIGVGQSNPAYSLDIVGDLNFSGTIRANGLLITSPSYWSSNSGTVFITNSNVGIGTSIPAYTLDIAGSVNVNKALSNNNKLIVLYDTVSSEAPSNATAFHGFGINSNAFRYQVPATNCSNIYNVNNIAYTSIDASGLNVLNGALTVGISGTSNNIQSVGNMTIWPNIAGNNSNAVYSVGSNNSTGDHIWYAGTTELMRIKGSDGSVNIVDNLICSNLTITGTAVATGYVGVGISNPTAPLVVNTTSSNYASGSNYSITVNNYVVAKDYDDSSDARLKTNITYIRGGMLEKIGMLRPCEFEYTTNQTGLKNIGLIAQDVEEVLPQCVSSVHDPISDIPDLRSLNYQQLTTAAFAAMQELKVEIDEIRFAMHL